MASTIISHLEFSAPIRLLSESNLLEHWSKKHKRKKVQQEEILVEMSNALLGRRVNLPCRVTLTRVGAKLLDPGNIETAFKAVQDSIAAKLGVDDGDTEKVQWVYQQEAIGKHKYSVRVEIDSI